MLRKILTVTSKSPPTEAQINKITSGVTEQVIFPSLSQTCLLMIVLGTFWSVPSLLITVTFRFSPGGKIEVPV